MLCQYPKCRNLATVKVKMSNGTDADAYRLCDDCLDAVRDALRNHGLDPDDEPQGWEITPCPTI